MADFDHNPIVHDLPTPILVQIVYLQGINIVASISLDVKETVEKEEFTNHICCKYVLVHH